MPKHILTHPRPLASSVVCRSLGLIRQSQCTRYDPLNAPGEYHLWGLSFNSSVVPAGAYAGEGVVMAASGAITRYLYLQIFDGKAQLFMQTYVK